MFVYRPDKPVRSVSVAGAFNSWNRAASPMRLGPDGKTWSLSVDLAYGKQMYKFVVDGDHWVLDPNAPSQDDGGNRNSVLMVVPADYSVPASARDGIIARSGLWHDQTPSGLNYDRGRLTFTLRARRGDLASVALQLGRRSLPMSLVSSGDLYSFYRAEIPWNRKSRLAYSFRLTDGTRRATYGARGLGSGPFTLDPKSFRPFEVPSWVERSVIYQIFPDRFADGDRSNDPKGVMAWDAKPTFYNRFGGDAAGVLEHLGYLKGLGVSAIYFNPVFKSPSNHRYDAADYRQIDPEFGTNAEFGTLTQRARAMGMRTVMDFAFNHSAVTFPPFLDIREHGPASKYTNWYFITGYPVEVKANPNYVGWWGSPYMPKLNVMNPATNRYLLGTVDFWSRQASGFEGMRLDAANEVDDRFWKQLRPLAKSLDPDMWIVGEYWGDASHWLQGDMWDSTMNYRFRDAVLRFVADGSSTPSQFGSSLMGIYADYAPQVSRNLMNLLGSHDTARFLTLCKGSRDLAELGAALQFTWVGAPSIYYGDELGMEGGPDPDCRRGMRWDRANAKNPVLGFYRRLIAIRNGSRALQSGDPELLLTDDKDHTFAFSRVLGDDEAVVAVNRSSRSQSISIPLSKLRGSSFTRRSGFIDMISGLRIRPGRALHLALSPLRAAILLPATRTYLHLAAALGTAGAASRT